MELITIREVSKRFNVSTRTLRYYEQIGLIEPVKRDEAAARRYDENALLRLKQIVVLRKLRIPLKSIAEILIMENTARSIEIFEQKLNELGDEINALNTIKNVIAAFLARLNIPDARLQLLDDESILEIVDSLTIAKSNVKEEPNVSDLNQADEKLSKLTEKDVRIIYLPPATVAAYQYEGDEPERLVNQVVDKFVKDADLKTIKPDVRHYGFNAPNPVDETNAHGYEIWVTIPDEMEVPAPLVKKRFEGGQYAARMIPFGAFEEWGRLWQWVEQSEKYTFNNAGKGGECMFGLLEEHLNYVNHIDLENTEPDDMQLDLLIPIKLRG